MADQATQHLARADEARAEVERYRAGEPTRWPLLWQAGLWETPADALEALRSGAWQPVACEFCGDWPTIPAGCVGEGKKAHCPFCFGTGLSWSERHAELAAYAGCESLRLPTFDVPEYWRQIEKDSASRFAGEVRGLWGTVPPAMAALGVVRAWARQEMSAGQRMAVRRALDVVERWGYWPSEENRAAVDSAWNLLEAFSPASRLCNAVRGGEQTPQTTIQECLDRGLPEATAAQAARDEVRRWSLAGLRGRHPAPA